MFAEGRGRKQWSRSDKETGSQRHLGLLLGTGEKHWPIADQCVPSNHPRNNCGTHFGTSQVTSRFYGGEWQIVHQKSCSVLFSLFKFHWTLTLLKIAFYSPCQWLKLKVIFCRQGPSLLTTLPEGFHLHAAPGVVPIDRTLQPTPLPAFLSTYIPKVRCVVYGVTYVSSISHGTVWYHSLLCSCKCFLQQRANLLVTLRSYSFWMGNKG